MISIKFVSTLLVLSLATGCTVAPKPVDSHLPSFDGNAMNSGVLSVGPAGYVITLGARDRYLALVAIYGSRFKPALTGSEGIAANVDNTFTIDRQHMVDFVQMSTWNRGQRK